VYQVGLDDNVLPAVPVTIFGGCEHEWVAKPGPQTDRAREMVKAFVARQLKAG
jgi:hypothetical protein